MSARFAPQTDLAEVFWFAHGHGGTSVCYFFLTHEMTCSRLHLFPFLFLKFFFFLLEGALVFPTRGSANGAFVSVPLNFAPRVARGLQFFRCGPISEAVAPSDFVRQ